MRKVAAFFLLLVLPSFVLAQPLPERPVILLGRLTDAERITLTSALAAKRPEAIILSHSPGVQDANRCFLKLARVEKVWPVGGFDDLEELAKSYGVELAKVQSWTAGPEVNELREQLWLSPVQRVMVCPPSPRGRLLQMANLAGVAGWPLIVLDGSEDQRSQFLRLLYRWKVGIVLTDGIAEEMPGLPTGLRMCPLEVHKNGQLPFPPAWGGKHLVAVNPFARSASAQALSSLGPLFAIQRNGWLLLSDAQGRLQGPRARAYPDSAETLLLLGDHAALPPERRPNPTPNGKDAFIETEPTIPTGKEPVSLAVGRLFHEDAGFVLLALARQKLLQQMSISRPKALVVSNPGESLPLLETLSRHTAQQLRNAGYDTTALFGDSASRERVRQLLPEQTLFLWEGHYSTLVRDYEVQRWPEPLRPSLIFLQSCLALTDDKAHPFLERGAVAVLGSPSRNYSASGGAFALAFTSALVYERQSVGEAVRHARNFLLCFSQLKQGRLDGGSQLGGANLRSMWGFALWGDPLLRLPAPPHGPALPPVRHEVKGDRLLVKLPAERHPCHGAGDYHARIWPGARLGGLYRKIENGRERELVPLVFVEFHVPNRRGQRLHLQSRLPAENWVLSWDQRRGVGYLLIRPRNRDTGTLRFEIRG